MFKDCLLWTVQLELSIGNFRADASDGGIVLAF